MESVIEKIQKLLALSGSPNEHEAKLALGKARELMERHNISLETVESTELDRANWRIEDLHTCGRTPPYELECVLQTLQRIFFVRGVCLKSADQRTRTYRLFGSAENVAVAKHAFVYLSAVFRSLWSEYRRLHGAPTSTARMYYHGLQTGLVDKILAERKLNASSSHALTVIELRIDEALRREFPQMRLKRTTLRGNQQAYSRGLEDGREIELNRPLQGAANGHSPELGNDDP